ncbi:homeobox-leucine zipper family protein [Actinidia rufa]|uniref:Homeobox-leucine zipper family protein n=1 Tax=Actinidia rufa TaxID=165716 RepID=A0A7J0G6B5_9ERIC|nr:homeobox-leucine zipper family protein [Actinidia rufa]
MFESHQLVDMSHKTAENDMERMMRGEDEFESKSGTDIMEAPSGDDDPDPTQRAKRKRYHRHTQHQIQEMESRSMSGVRTHKLRNENDKLRAENIRYKEALSNATCPNCGGPATIGEMSFDEQHLRIENARLREEPMLTYPNGPARSIDLGVGNFGLQSGLVGDLYGPGDILRTVSGPTEADKPMIIELAVAAMEEVIRMAQSGEPLWVSSPGPKPLGLKSEASRESAVVIMNHVNLVEILMDVMTAEYQVPSPLVPTRENYFVRYCKQHADGTWAVVDVSLDNLRPSSASRCRRRPSGCLIQEVPNGYSKVIWVEHVEVDDRAVHSLYRPLVNSGLAFGAKRWVATLDRQCERLASAMANSIPADVGVITTSEGRKSMLKLAERMVMSFCTGVGASTAHAWTTHYLEVEPMMVPPITPNLNLLHMTTQVIPCLSTLNFVLKQWDILSNGGLVQEMAHIANGRDPGNSVSLLRVNSANSSQSNMLILQESCTDSTGSYVIYAPVDIVAMNVVLSGGDPDYVALLPSGFAILPDGPTQHGAVIPEVGSGGSLLTVAFQILVDSVPTAKLSLGSVATVNSLIKCTVERIKSAVGGENV